MLIVIADEMEKEVVEGLRALGTVQYKPADLKNTLTNADVLIVRSATKVTKELLESAKKLQSMNYALYATQGTFRFLFLLMIFPTAR